MSRVTKSRWFALCALLATPALASCESDTATEELRAEKEPKETAREVSAVATADEQRIADERGVAEGEGMVSNVGAVAELRPSEAVGDTSGIGEGTAVVQDRTEAAGDDTATEVPEETTEDGFGTGFEDDDTFGDTDALDDDEEDSWGTGFEDDDTFGDTNAFD